MNSNEMNPENLGRCRHGRRHWIKVPFIIAAIVVVKSAIVMWLWNELVPDLFHGPQLVFVQAVGLTILAKLLFGFGGGFGRHGMGHHRFGRHMGRHMERHLAKMTPEEKQRFMEEFKGKFE